ncbi:MAG TPA: LapA family protein [Candidimonas sp.]|nr:LapA family protein [Candidimonas sp.]
MRYLVWILRLIVFVVVLMFALKNTGPVDINFFADHIITGVPLIVVMLTVFVLGAIFGLLIAAPSIMRRRREASRLRRDVARLEGQLKHPAAPGISTPGEALAPETVAPLAPL